MQVSLSESVMNDDNLLLVESLDKDWEDSVSELSNAEETDPLEMPSKNAKNSEDDSEEVEKDPLAEKSNESINNDEYSKSIDCTELIDDKISSKSVDRPENITISDNHNSNFMSSDTNSILSNGIDSNLPVGEIQRFIVHFNSDEITLTPDNSTSRIPSISAENSVLECAEITVDHSQSTDMLKLAETASESPKIPIFKKKKPIAPICKGERIPRKNTVEKNFKNQPHIENAAKVPSVYSYSEIKRHKRRLTLKALQDDSVSNSDSDSKSSENDFDPDLDVNLRIIEGNNDTVGDSNVIIGEIHCDVVAEDKNNIKANSERQNKNTNIFKLSVNADFSENTEINQMSDETKSYLNIDEEDADDITDDDMNGLRSLYDDDFFSDNDSDLEILTAKSITRKRSSMTILRKETPANTGQRTMLDLIYDTVQPTPRVKTKSKEPKPKAEPKKRVPKKTKTNPSEKKPRKKPSENEDTKLSTVTENEKTSAESTTSKNHENCEKLEGLGGGVAKELDKVNDEITRDALPVPQLKVNADGQIIIDTDSLTIEQTGVAEARQALANSEVVEEFGLNYKSYSKKNNFRKQWSPPETLKFYDVLSVVGTDFTLMATLFPGRTRNCIKRKYKREEKINRDLIMKALTSKQKFNIGLLEKELKLKEERVNLLKQNAKKKKEKAKEKSRPKSQKKEESKVENKTSKKRKSFFERGISCFQDS